MHVSKKRRHLGTWILGTSLSVTAVLVFFPSGWIINRLNVRIWWLLRKNTPLSSQIIPEDLAFLWNVVMFIPLGIGLALVAPRWWWAIVLCVSSIGIEMIQLLLPSRNSDVMDVVMNTSGGTLGVVSTLLVLRWCDKSSNESIDSPHA